nr:hypothetical protein [Microbacterium lemovicicum]
MTLIENIERTPRHVETAGWAFAARTTDADKAEAVEAALVRDGAMGLADLALAGPACGGLDANDVEEILGMVGRRLASV